MFRRKVDNYLVIGDTQLPFAHKEYLKFLKAVKEKYKCNKIIHVGDLMDNYNFSRYDKSPDAPNVKRELKEIKKSVKEWGKVFPEMDVVIGNHDARIQHRLEAAGFSKEIISMEKVYREAYQMPDGWRLHDSLLLKLRMGDCRVIHGDEVGTSAVAGRTRNVMGISVIHGHRHSKAFIDYRSTPDELQFDMIVGCGIDDEALAFSYNKKDILRPIISCGILLDGVPHIIPMFMNKKRKWDGRV